MAAAALRERDFAAAKLQDSVRQLRRSLDQVPPSERAITQKSERVDIDRDELLAKQYAYTEKSGTTLADQESKEYLEPKIDEAVDIIDEAYNKLETLRKDKQETADAQKTESAKTREIVDSSSVKLKAESKEKLLLEMITEVEKLFIDSPTTKEALTAESYLSELAVREVEYYEAWSEVKAKVTAEADLLPIIRREEGTQKQVSSVKLRARQLCSKVKSSEETRNRLESTTLTDFGPASRACTNVKLARMNPPKFSGNIRDFARFKTDFEKIVQTSYTDSVHQVYVMKNV